MCKVGTYLLAYARASILQLFQQVLAGALQVGKVSVADEAADAKDAKTGAPAKGTVE